jgi:hypothetical protein
MLGALGNALFAISYSLGYIAPSVALDFSLVGVIIAGFYGGAETGFITGLIAGVLPGIMFGPMGNGGVLGLVGLPFGKALSGLTAGTIAGGIKLGQRPRSSLIAIPSTLLAYVPESIFTYAYFIILLGLEAGAATFFIYILPKALLEVIIISVLMAALMGNAGFSHFVRAHFMKMSPTEK